jgi:hypothetical protein
MLSIFFSPVTDDRLSAGVDVNVFKRDFLPPAAPDQSAS